MVNELMNDCIRPYEISLWNLLDSFITVLKGIQLNYKGTISEPKMSLVDDGTLELTFTIPMYLRENNGTYVENPIWYNIINGNLIANMRKLKVIFNKATADELVFEFLIVKVIETHKEGLLNCEITAEGLPFHELGKLGYKVALEEDNFTNVYDIWEKNPSEEKGEEPLATLQFWNELMGILEFPTNGLINPNIWYYKIEMDWSSYANAHLRDSNKIYEEEYTSAWKILDDIVMPLETKSAEEKARIVNLTNSNYYNLSLDLAKEFGVFCKYLYLYDDNYHIIGRIIVYYNNFINELNGVIDFSYPYSSSEITREMDGTDLITKLYVDTIDDDSTVDGVINIMNTEANLSGEDYLLNFEYMYSIGAISEDLYKEIKTYEAKIGTLNRELIKYSDLKNSYEALLPIIEAALEMAKAGLLEALAGVDDNNKLMEALDLKDKTLDSYITSSVQIAGVIRNDDGTASINLKENGIDFDSVEIYTGYTHATNTLNTNTRIERGSPYYDKFGNLTRINYLSIDANINIVYITYRYSPKLYYLNIIDTWNLRLAKDEAAVNENLLKYDLLNTVLNEVNRLYDLKLSLKEELRASFARLMGPALREGPWTPDNYKNCENKVLKTYNILLAEKVTSATRDTSIPLIWDKFPFDGELKSYYKVGLAEQEIYYHYIPIDSEILNFISSHMDEEIGIRYYNYTATEINPHELARAKSIIIGSKCLLAFKSNGYTVEPIILLTAEESMSEEEINYLLTTGRLSIVHRIVNGNVINYSETLYKDEALEFHNLSSSDLLVSLRYQIDTTHLKTGAKTLYFKYNGILLEEYKDYSVLIEDGKYYLTIKPEVLFRDGSLEKDVYISYTLSNASTAIYLDAKLVLKENSIPRVSYTIATCVFNKDFMHTAYKQLNRIININDYELKFENVLGYISSLNLDLDKPFEDNIEVKNYKTKFEDLFTSIVASTELMLKNSATFYAVSLVLNPDGSIKSSSLQQGISKVDLNYAFNNGTLSITNDKGIWGVSDNGVVAIRGGGIFTATDKDVNGDWIWNTGITPQGINAELITTGLLDTKKIVIYAGDLVKFLWNDKGIYAYKSFLDDPNLSYLELELGQTLDEPLDRKLYVIYNSEGLFLRAEEGAKIITKISDDPLQYKLHEIAEGKAVDRVEISWNGLILRNFNGTDVFKADPDTGDLFLEGTIEAASGKIGGWTINSRSLSKDLIDPNTNVVTHLLTISPDTGINFMNKFIVDENGYLKIVGEQLNTGTIIFKATSNTIGFYNQIIQNELEQEHPLLTIDNAMLNVNGGLNVNATGELKLITDNLCIDSNVDLNNPTEILNEGADKYYNIYSLGYNLLSEPVYHILYKKHIKTENDIDTINYIFSIGNKLIYTFNENDSNLSINGSGTFSGDLIATTLTIGNNGKYMKYDNNGLNIGNGGLTYDGNTFSVNGVINATGGNFSGTINGGTFNGATISTDNLTVGYDGSNALTYTSANGLLIGSSDAYLKYTDDGLEVKGIINATGGSFGDWTIRSGFFCSSSTAGFGILSGDFGTATSDWLFLVDPAALTYGNGKFTVTSGGTITSEGLKTSGIEATGNIYTSASVNATNIYATHEIALLVSSTERYFYATQQWVNDLDYATQTWVNDKGYLTESDVRSAIKAALDKNNLSYPDEW